MISKRTILALSILLACFFVLSCGKKEWPTPKVTEDTFTWERVKTTRKGECLFVECQLGGKFKNLASVALQVQPEDKGCPDCPFTPYHIEKYDFSSKSMRQVGPYVRIVYCGLEQNKSYRIRLAGQNKHKALGESLSLVYITTPEDK